MRTIAEMLASSGFVINALATTAVESNRAGEIRPYLEKIGCNAISASEGVEGRRPVISFDSKGISYKLLDTGPSGLAEWEKQYGEQFNGLFSEALTSKPDLILTFGGSEADILRRKWARQKGVRVVFGLRNWGYLRKEGLAETDAILTPSKFLSRQYKTAINIESVALPLPLDFEEVVAPIRDPKCLTYINPTIHKGIMFFSRLTEELCVRRPDIPILIVESRGRIGDLVAAGLSGGFDLRRHRNITTMKTSGYPRDIFARTRILVVPSVWEEPGGRVAAEALLNGVPPLVSNRGGLQEICADGGTVLPLPASLTTSTLKPVSAEETIIWRNEIEKLFDIPDWYAAQVKRAIEGGKTYEPAAVQLQYAAFFAKVGKRNNGNQMR
jgi:Glycosyl transferases group 1